MSKREEQLKENYHHHPGGETVVVGEVQKT